MITAHDLDAAIAECLGKKNPDASTCIKLAAFYTIKQELYPSADADRPPAYSYSPGPVRDDVVEVGSGSEFARTVDGLRPDEVWPVMDELMKTLSVINPRLYNAVLARF